MVMMIMPVMLIFMSIFLLIVNVKNLNIYKTFDFTEKDNAESFYMLEHVNVRTTLSGLHYSGFQENDKGKVLGNYFYKESGGSVVFYLLDEKTSSEILSGQDNVEILCSIRKDNSGVEYMLGEYSEETGKSVESLEGLFSSYILDQTEYPYVRLTMLSVLYYIPLCMMVLLIIYLPVAMVFPYLNFQLAPLRKKGIVKELVDDIDYESRNMMLYDAGSIFVTENYLVNAFISRVDIVKLDDIKYLSGREEIKKGLFGREYREYRLTASNVEKFYYECTVGSPEILEKLIYYIRREDMPEAEG